MFSRFALPLVSKATLRLPQRNPQLLWSVASTTSVAKPAASNVATGSEERDLVNFPRRLMPEYGGKVRIAFIPDEWFQFFYRKTGVTGPYLFGTGLVTFLCSKEWYIMEHDFYMGLGIVIFWTYIIKTYGTKIEAYIDKVRDEDFSTFADAFEASKQAHVDAIKEEEKLQWRTQGQDIIFDAKRENVSLQLEAEYRKRLFETYQEVKKRLDYHVQSINTTRQVHHKHMVSWIINNVVSSISPQQEEEALKKCIGDLKQLAAAH